MNIMGFELFQTETLITVVLFGYAIFTLSKCLKVYLRHHQVFTEYRRNHEDVIDCNLAKNYVWFYWVLAAISLILALYDSISSGFDIYQIASIFLAAIVFGMGFDALIKRRLLIVPNTGFCYEDQVYQFRSIVSMEPVQKTILAFVSIKTSKGESFLVTKKMGKVLHEYHEQYKSERKRRK